MQHRSRRIALPAGEGSILGRQRAQPGDDVAEIGVGHVGVIAEAHRRLEMVDVLVDALS